MTTSPTSPADMESLAARVDSLADSTLLCIGDIMLDRFVYGAADRISPEAPIPVFSVRKEDAMLGGAGNVLRNIVSLGASASFISVVGDDRTGSELIRMVGQEKSVSPYLLVERGRISTEKTRYIAASQQLLRADHESRAPINAAIQDQIIAVAEQEVAKHDALLLSDYGKGVLTPSLVAALIAMAKRAGKPVIIDPKSRDFSLYKGAFLVSPNLQELAAAANMELHDEAAIVTAGRKLMQAHRIENILVTRGKDGMTLVAGDGDLHIPAGAREVYDVSGAGDTVIATLATTYAAGLNLQDAARLANIAAGIAVGRMGTAVVYRTDLKTALHTQQIFTSQNKIQSLSHAREVADHWRHQHKKIGFTNGCFDIMHAGHLALLHEAKSLCDQLIVAVNSDASVRRLKGKERPVNSEIERAMMLAALSVVDLVVIFREDTPLELLEALKPDLLIKGADYTKDQVVGGGLVESYGGQVKLIALKDGYSTTGLIKKLAGV